MTARPSCDADEVGQWFTRRVPKRWFTGPPAVAVDRDEILVVGTLRAPRDLPEGADAERVALLAHISAFRDETRDHRVQLAEEAQARWRRVVSWGARCRQVEVRFTTASVPVMTRLRIDERAVLDTLIDAGVARSRSEALAWCVRLVGQHQGDWIRQLRDAMEAVQRIRSQGPDL